jgi:hypothetical protein
MERRERPTDGKEREDERPFEGEGEPPFLYERAIHREGKPEVRLSFALVIHDPRENYLEKALEALSDVDILALEAVAWSEERKRKIEEATNLLAYADRNPDDPMFKRAFRQLFFLTPKDLFGETPFRKIFLHIIGIKKRIVFIDVSKEEMSEHVSSCEEAERRFSESLYREPTPLLLAKLERWFREEGMVVRMREERVVEQLLSLVDRELSQGRESVRIGVLEGAAHTWPSHEMKRRGYEVTRTFVPEFSPRGGNEELPKFLYFHSNEAIRHVRFFPDRPLPEELLKRALLERYLAPLFAADRTLYRDGRAPSHVKKAAIRKIAESFSEEDLDIILEDIDRLKSQGESPAETMAQENRERIGLYLKDVLERLGALPLPSDEEDVGAFLRTLKDRRDEERS